MHVSPISDGQYLNHYIYTILANRAIILIILIVPTLAIIPIIAGILYYKGLKLRCFVGIATKAPIQVHSISLYCLRQE